MIDLALFIAVNTHYGQVDKSGQPYILHPLHVAHQFPPSDHNHRAVAILHDVLEANPALGPTLQDSFPTLFTSILAITRLSHETYADYIHRCAADPTARAVKIEDVKHNLYRLTPELESLRTRYTKALEILQ